MSAAQINCAFLAKLIFSVPIFANIEGSEKELSGSCRREFSVSNMFRTSKTSKPKVLSVSELTAQIQSTLEDRFDNIAVSGEISNAKSQASGHLYFSLKDADAILTCVCWRSTAQFIPFELQDGLKVVARGKIAVYPPRGNYQLIVNTLQPVGIGDWQLAFEQLKEKLEKEGMLAPERKRPIPLLPRRIGVVTSPTAAALHDILSALKRRNPNVQVLISPCRVQGEGSAEEIAAAIQDLQTLPEIDVIVVARGGGSIEDLWSFNTEIVARAVLASSIPVISGVGHETDVTICDLVADLRAPTPTAAAELVAQGRLVLMDRWSGLNRRLLHNIEQRLASAKLSLTRLDPRHALLKHVERLKNASLAVHNKQERLRKAIDLKLVSLRHRQDRAHEKLLALSALNVLKRGFAILQKQNGAVITSSAELTPGETIIGRLYSGKLKLKVEELFE